MTDAKRLWFRPALVVDALDPLRDGAEYVAGKQVAVASGITALLTGGAPKRGGSWTVRRYELTLWPDTGREVTIDVLADPADPYSDSTLKVYTDEEAWDQSDCLDPPEFVRKAMGNIGVDGCVITQRV